MEPMSEPFDTSVAEHYAWGDHCDGWHLLATDALSVIEERMPPGTAETAHAHARAHQFFYVLSGRATMELDGGSVDIGPGQGLDVPPGIRHRMTNVSDADLRFLVISSPKSHGDRA